MKNYINENNMNLFFKYNDKFLLNKYIILRNDNSIIVLSKENNIYKMLYIYDNYFNLTF